jgi:hypothetical protein
MQTVRFNRAQYRRDWLRAHHSYERGQYVNFKRALDKQIQPVVDFIGNGGIDQLATHLKLLIRPDHIEKAYYNCYVSIGTKHAGWTYQHINGMVKSDGIGFFSSAWKHLMSLFYTEHSSQRVTRVTETTRERIMNALDKANEQNLSKAETATLLQKELDSPDFNRNRALMIARTESTTAANYGATLGAESSDYETGKVWIPVMDMNTRPDHAAMDGSAPIGMDETFAVGDSEMLYPGDPAGSAREVIQCRCVLGIVPLMDFRGMPVLKMR